MGFLLPCLCLPSQAAELKSWRKKVLGADVKGPIPLCPCCGLGEEQTCDTALLQNLFYSDKIISSISLWQNLGSFFLLGGE